MIITKKLTKYVILVSSILMSGCASLTMEKDKWVTNNYYSVSNNTRGSGFVEFFTFNKLDIYDIGKDVYRKNPLKLYVEEKGALKLLGPLGWKLDAEEQAWNRYRISIAPGTYKFIIKSEDYVEVNT